MKGRSMVKVNDKQDMVYSHMTLRRLLGVIGTLLPIVLACSESQLRHSISAYYYSKSFWIHGYFVGSLCALGAFLCCYKGYPREAQDKWKYLSDNVITTIAGVGAIVTAIVPAKTGLPHLIAAVSFCIAGILMCLLRFRKTCRACQPNRTKMVRNSLYVVCAITICASLVLSVVLKLTGHSIFWPEAAAVFAFGVAWFVKGQTERVPIELASRWRT